MTRDSVKDIQALLESKIIGRTREAWQCCCGAIKHSESVAVAVRPPKEDKYFNYWHLWEVCMRHTREAQGYNYSCGLNNFVEINELEKIFRIS